MAYDRTRYLADPERFKAESKARYYRCVQDDPVGFKRQTFDRMIWRKYRMTREDYDALLWEQHGRCALCGQPAELNIDHCHETGRIRGLLCFKCNTALGQLGDTPSSIREVLEYVDGV